VSGQVGIGAPRPMCPVERAAFGGLELISASGVAGAIGALLLAIHNGDWPGAKRWQDWVDWSAAEMATTRGMIEDCDAEGAEK